MNQTPNSYGIGALAGVATMLLALGVTSGSGLAVILYLLSPLPIMVAGLGWGLGAGIAGIVVAALGIAVVGNGETAVVITLTTTVPAAMCAFLMGLSRPAEEMGGPKGQIAWYPLSDVLFRLALMTAIAFVVIGVLIDYGPELMAQFADQFISRLQEADPEFAFTPEARTEFVSAMTGMLPLIQPALWMMLLVANLYFALSIARASGKLSRPREVWPISMRMPRPALLAFGAALVASFFTGNISLVASVFVGALLGGFTLAGFAVMHERTMGKAWRPIALIVVYFSVALTLVAAIPFALLGLIATARHVPITPGGTPPNPPSGPNAT